MLAAYAATNELSDDAVDMDIADMLDNGPFQGGDRNRNHRRTYTTDLCLTPDLQTRPRRSLLDLPPEVLDRIFAKVYAIIDHFCLSWTCQLLNRAYTKAIWSVRLQRAARWS